MNTSTKGYVWKLEHTVTGKVHTKVFSSRREAREMTENTRFKNYRPVKVTTALGKNKKTAKKAAPKTEAFNVPGVGTEYVPYEADLMAFLASFLEPYKSRKTVGTPVHMATKLGLKN